MTENLVMANLTGHDSHGIGMLPRYSESPGRRRAEGERAHQDADGRRRAAAHRRPGGFRPGGRTRGDESGIERAKKFGSCIMALGKCAPPVPHRRTGRRMAVAAGFVSIHFVNVISRPIVAPFGGSDARFGTNPFTVGIPVRRARAVLLDFATSVIAQGKARVAHNKGEKLAPGRSSTTRAGTAPIRPTPWSNRWAR